MPEKVYIIWRCPRCQHEKTTSYDRMFVPASVPCERPGCSGKYRIFDTRYERRKS
jgi:hypothetical protein